MGKSNRVKVDKATQTMASPLTKKTEKKGVPTWLGTLILVTVLVAFVVIATFFALDSAGVFNRMRVVMATENFEVTVPMMSYMVNTKYQERVAYYDNLIQQIGGGGNVNIPITGGEGGVDLDRNKPLRDQIYTTKGENGETLETPMTWFDYFAKQAVTETKQWLALCEAATAAGVKLDKEDKKAVDVAIDSLSLIAAENNFTTNGYIAAVYGQGVNKRDVRDMMRISSLATKYSDMRANEIIASVDDSQVNAEYTANQSKYDVYIDYIGYSFDAIFTPSSNKDATLAQAENVENAKKYEEKKAKYRLLREELATAAQNDPTTFNAKLTTALQTLFKEEAEEQKGSALTQEEKNACDARAVEAVANAVMKNVDTSVSSMDPELSDWLKETSRKSGDVFRDDSDYNAFGEVVKAGEEADSTEGKDYKEATSSFSVYLVTSAMHRDEGTVRSAAQILFRTETYKNLKSSKDFSGAIKELADRVLAKHDTLSAELMAQELLALMRDEHNLKETTTNGKTYYAMDEAVFKAYGDRYNESYNGVYLDNVKSSEEKELEEWIFDASRVVGEVSYPSVVQTSEGYKILMYRGDEKPSWSHTIRVSLAEGKYDAWAKELIDATALKKDNTNNVNYMNRIGA